MNKKHERFGLMFEIAGLIFLLVATFWEAEYTSWWDKSSLELQYFIQEEANLSTLEALAAIAQMEAVEDPETRAKIASTASRKARDATFEIIKKRDERLEILKGQPELFSKIRLYLLCIGAGLILIGKLVFLRSYRGI